MLVLSRGKNESLVINDSITVTVLEIRGPIVRIGIEAPREMNIVREELLEHCDQSDAARRGNGWSARERAVIDDAAS